MTTANPVLSHFLDNFNLYNLITEPTCYKSVANPSCIDLILTNSRKLFMKSRTFETGISDFHKLTTTVMKLHYLKSNKRTLHYRDYKNFDEDFFNDHLKLKLNSLDEINYTNFQECFLELLNSQAPIKKKFIRGNNQPFMTKTLRKAIMTRSKLRNRYNQLRTPENWKSYKKQRNFCVNLYKKTKKDYFNSLEINKLKDNKHFWKTIKPFFSDKGINSQKSILIEKDIILTKETDISEVMNKYFVNIGLEIKSGVLDGPSTQCSS